MKKYFLFYLTLNLVACNDPKSSTNAAFYYWKSSFLLSKSEHQILDTLNTKRLYVKYFDVQWNETTQSALPVAKINFEDSLTNFEVVPVVFITNEALLKTIRIENLTTNISQ